jgi:hypothetical protein
MQDKSERSEFLENSKKMLFALVYPRKKEHLHMDQKTKDYLHNVEKKIGLVDIIRKWENTLLSVEYRYPLFWNPSCEGYAHVGRKGNYWVAQVSLVSDGFQHDIVRYLFSCIPQPEDVLIANTLNQIYAFYRSQNHMVSQTVCNQCGNSFHWIDQKGTLEDKWVSFQEEYCGCD